jgi:AAA15 family ATPase/GTPase
MDAQHLEYLHIQNFRPFEDIQIDGLKHVNLITGKNNVGKTALLEAIMILKADMISRYEAVDFLYHILFNRGCIYFSAPSVFNVVRTYQSFFTNGNNDEFKFNDNIFTLDIGKRSASLSNPAQKSTINLSNFTETQKRKFEIPLNWLENTFYFIPATFTFDNREFWKNIKLTPKKKLIIEILQIIEPKIIDFDIDSATNVADVLLEGEETSRPFKTMGEGVNRLLTVALALINAQNAILLIDEFEIGLHHSIQKQIWNLVFTYSKKLNVQVFATTHSRDCIKAFTETAKSNEAFKGMSNYFRLQHGRKTGKIVAVPYNWKDLDAAIELNIETR